MHLCVIAVFTTFFAPSICAALILPQYPASSGWTSCVAGLGPVIGPATAAPPILPCQYLSNSWPGYYGTTAATSNATVTAPSKSTCARNGGPFAFVTLRTRCSIVQLTVTANGMSNTSASMTSVCNPTSGVLDTFTFQVAVPSTGPPTSTTVTVSLTNTCHGVADCNSTIEIPSSNVSCSALRSQTQTPTPSGSQLRPTATGTTSATLPPQSRSGTFSKHCTASRSESDSPLSPSSVLSVSKTRTPGAPPSRTRSSETRSASLQTPTVEVSISPSTASRDNSKSRSSSGSPSESVSVSWFRPRSSVSIHSPSISGSATFSSTDIIVPLQQSFVPSIITAAASAAQYTLRFSVASGSATTPVSVVRSSASIRLMLCVSTGSDAGGLLPIMNLHRSASDHVLPAEDADAVATARGTIVVNVAILLVAACLLLTLAIVYRYVSPSPVSVGAGLLRVAAPSSLLVVLIAVAPSSIGGTALIVTIPHRHTDWTADAADGLLAAVGLLPAVFLAAYFAACFSSIVRWDLVCEWNRDCDRPKERALRFNDNQMNVCSVRGDLPAALSDLLRLRNRLATRRYRWDSPSNSTAPSIDPSSLIRCFWATLLEFRHVWYSAVNVAVVLVVTSLSVVMGELQDTTLCRGSMWFVTTLYVTQLAVCVLARPTTTMAGDLAEVLCLTLSASCAFLQSVIVTLDLQRNSKLTSTVAVLVLLQVGVLNCKHVLFDAPSMIKSLLNLLCSNHHGEGSDSTSCGFTEVAFPPVNSESLVELIALDPHSVETSFAQEAHKETCSGTGSDTMIELVSLPETDLIPTEVNIDLMTCPIVALPPTEHVEDSLLQDLDHRHSDERRSHASTWEATLLM